MQCTENECKRFLVVSKQHGYANKLAVSYLPHRDKQSAAICQLKDILDLHSTRKYGCDTLVDAVPGTYETVSSAAASVQMQSIKAYVSTYCAECYNCQSVSRRMFTLPFPKVLESPTSTAR